MTLTAKDPFWSRSYDPIHSRGLAPEPPVGTKLGRLQVNASIEKGETFEYRGIQFTDYVSYFKDVYHGAAPKYDFSAGSGRVFVYDIPESEVPAEVLEAFDREVDSSRW